MNATLPDSLHLLFEHSPIGVAVLMGTEDLSFQNASLLYANPSFLGMTRRPDDFDMIALVTDLCQSLEGNSLLPLPPHKKESGESSTKSLTQQWPNPREELDDENYEPDLPLDATKHDKEAARQWLEIRAQPIMILGEPGHYLWVTDVTNSKQREIEAQEQAARADAAAEAKSAFFAMMSHEIRTPMQTIFGLLELMADEKPQDSVMTMIGTARNSANNMLELLDDILDLAKVDAGKMELEALEMPIRTLVEGVVEALHVRARQSGLMLRADVADDVPKILYGDPKRLRQVLTNLIGNALKFTEQGSVTVRVSKDVSTIKVNESLDTIPIRIEIIDTGIGMTDEVANKLFKPFTQAESSTTRRFGGTGLGLSICARLVDLMGGQIGVTSEIGKGSTFWIEAPMHIHHATDHLEPLPELKGLAVLNVDHHEGSRREIETTLAAMGAQVTTVATAKEAREKLKKHPFDVALVDQTLEDMDGITLLKEVAPHYPSMGLILYTVHQDYALQQSCRFIGAHFLEKPASRRGLGVAVQTVSERAHPQKLASNRRILICEDHEVITDIFRKQMEKYGIEADFAVNGRKAQDHLRQRDYGMVITDLHMPDMDGYQLITSIREQEAVDEQETHLPVVVVTADVQLAHARAFMAHGFDECLLKPVAMEQLRRLLIRWGMMTDDAVEQDASTIEHDATATLVENNESEADQAGHDAIDIPTLEQNMGPLSEDTPVMLEKFIEMTQKDVDSLVAAIKDGDPKRIIMIAHTIKGAARTAGALRLGDLCAEIQETAEKGQTVDVAYVSKLEDSFAQLPQAVAEIKNKVA